jgi:hypothetical protein
VSNLAEILPVTHHHRQNKSIVWHEFARLMQIWMESVWMILWVWSIFNTRLNLSYWMLLLIFGSLMTLSYMFAIGLQRIKTSLLNIRLLFVGWTFICVWIAIKLVLYPTRVIGIITPFILSFHYVLEKNDIPSEVWLAIVTGLIVLRAVKLSQFHVSSYSVRNSFQIGLILLLFSGLFGINPHLPVPVVPVIVFLGLSLVGLSSAKLAEMSRQRGGSRVSLKPVWFLLITALTAGILLLGYLLAALMHWQAAGITDISVFILAILTTLLVIPFALVALLVTMILIPFLRLLTRIGLFQLFKLDPASLGIDPNLKSIPGLQRELPIAPIFVMIILVILLLAIAYLAGRIRRKKLMPFGENNLQIEVEHGDGEKNKGWLRRKIISAFDQFGSRMKIPNARKAWTAARIRRVYTQFLDLMNQFGTPREKSQTPLEYLPVATTILPAHQTDMETITRAYLLVRYREIPEDEEEVQMVFSAWQRINHAARPLLQEKKKKQEKKD